MRTLERTVEAIDQGLEVAGGRWKGIIKGLFGLEGLKSNADFAEVRVVPLRPVLIPDSRSTGHFIGSGKLAGTQLGPGG